MGCSVCVCVDTDRFEASERPQKIVTRVQLHYSVWFFPDLRRSERRYVGRTVAPGGSPLGHPWGLTREAPGGDGLARREVPQVGP